MLPKFFASWLIVLILLPFTAPFSTFDLADYLGRPERRHAPLARRRSGAVTNDVAVPGLPCVSATGRQRLLTRSDVPVVPAKIYSPSTRVTWLRAATDCIREHSLRTTILRL